MRPVFQSGQGEKEDPNPDQQDLKRESSGNGRLCARRLRSVWCRCNVLEAAVMGVVVLHVRLRHLLSSVKRLRHHVVVVSHRCRRRTGESESVEDFAIRGLEGVSKPQNRQREEMDLGQSGGRVENTGVNLIRGNCFHFGTLGLGSCHPDLPEQACRESPCATCRAGGLGGWNRRVD